MADAGWKRAAIDISTATTTAVITGVTGEYFAVKKMFLHSSGTNAVTIKSGTTVLCGKLDMVAQWRVLWDDEDDVSWLRAIASADSLNFVTTQAVQLSGWVVYQSSPN